MTQASSYLLLIKLLVKYIVENSLVLLSRVYFVVIHLREDIENFAKSVQC